MFTIDFAGDMADGAEMPLTLLDGGIPPTDLYIEPVTFNYPPEVSAFMQETLDTKLPPMTPIT
jgi:hypothetical protein